MSKTQQTNKAGPADLTLVDMQWKARAMEDGAVWVELILVPSDPTITNRPVLIAVPGMVVQAGGTKLLDALMRLVSSTIGAVAYGPTGTVQ